jgi:hypothetical protein
LLINDDENKVFGITFRTPPRDSTGVAHILPAVSLCAMPTMDWRNSIPAIARVPGWGSLKPTLA